MSEENKKNQNINEEESIEDILNSFQSQKKERASNDDEFTMPKPPMRSERQRIDFSKPENTKSNKKSEKKLSIKKPDIKKLDLKKPEFKKPDIKLNFNDIKDKLINKIKNIDKRILLIVISVVVIIAVLAGIIAGIIGGVSRSRVAYLKPYQQKYSSVTFPDGIQEKYCDMFGQHPDSSGYVKLEETGYDGVVLSKKSKKESLPYSEPNAKNCFQNNYVIYMNDNKLEEYYKDADSYNNKATGFIKYSDFIYDYSFKVVGAFYTNTKASDDNDYIFPYNVTEKLTDKSANAFLDRLQTRFLYDTGLTMTKEDKLITISCPTDFKKDFRFVVVGVLRNADNDKLEATDKSKIHYPQVIYDQRGENNPYRLAAKWYPEVIIKSSADTTKTSKQSIDEYK